MNESRVGTGRPESAITPEQIKEGLAFVSYAPFQGGTTARGTFTGCPFWADDESAHVVPVNIVEADPNHPLSTPGPKVVELCALGVGLNRHGETPTRVCIPDDLP